MNTLNRIIKTLIIAVLSYIILAVLSNLFLPEAAPVFNWVFVMLWKLFKEFFFADTIRTTIIAIIIAVVFGTISYKKENAIIGLIGAIIDIFIIILSFNN